MSVSAMQGEMARLGAWFFAVELIVLVIALFVLYLVIKSAVRDGIKEAGLTDAILALRKPIEEPKGPPIRAER
ncbi:MAG: hypothetical protein O9318_07220 [Hylemonella sp.]|uniref:hypothetical protein n=1 Tax=Hylemonella sp. TaxID=2066020 RepID=UPI0022BC9223|nr:hypothetical protein [Hylemonella sp.]MCZ8252243.1 hypothetical protein [Hylemonella sp.]